VTFEEWWPAARSGDWYSEKDLAQEVWQTAQEEFKKQLDGELAIAFMLGYEAAKSDYNRDK